MIEIDIIGVLYRAPVDPTDPSEILVPYPGWHVNITAEGLATRPDLEPYVATPSRMRRVWAGDDPEAPEWTVALRFPDQATADSVLFPTP